MHVYNTMKKSLHKLFYCILKCLCFVFLRDSADTTGRAVLVKLEARLSSEDRLLIKNDFF